MKILPLLSMLALLSFPALAQDTAPPLWTIDHDKSSLTFDSKQMGAAFTGTFSAYDGEIRFDPQDLEHSSAAIAVDIASLTTGSEERDGYVRAPQWFDAASFPQAHFVTTAFETGAEENAYIAKGDLTIRGVTLPVTLPFTLSFSEDGTQAHMKGTLTLNRLDYGVGQGEWKDTSMVPDAVRVAVDLHVTKEKAPVTAP